MTRNERGVSLPELLLVLAIIAVIASALVGAIYQIVDITSRGNNELLVQHDLRNAATWLNRDVLTASRATITGSEEDGIYEMTLVVPRLVISDTVVITTTDIIYTYYAYTYSEEQERGTLTRYSDSSGSSLTIARHIASNPFPLDTDIEAPNVITVTLYSLEGNVLGSGTFALKMRAGGSIAAVRLCQVTGAEHLVITPTSKTVQWDITNIGETSPSIDEIYIAWPSDENPLAWIDFDETLIYWGRHDTPATISSGWLGLTSRKIYSGTRTLEFNFDSTDVITDEVQYSITITLTDNCTFPFLPTP